jgi:S-adenosylmethionine decarboxylase
MAINIAGFAEIEDLFYSRKNYKKPELQVTPHRGFEEEVAFLDQFFDDGRAYCLGSVNRDCWYLYTLNRPGVRFLIFKSKFKFIILTVFFCCAL